MIHDIEELITSEAAAKLLCVAPQTLALWRCTRRHDLPYVKLGRRVRYKPSDIRAFLDRHTVKGAAA